jgi:DNA-binding CsgD family transcriptional regulator/tetratricopeptide (TPR) repeat protein
MRRRVDPGHFVERGPELDRLDAALSRAAAGAPSVVVVAGEAGVGKTRLLDEFAARVEGQVLWGACLPMGERGLPFAPVLEALRAFGSDPDLGDRLPLSLQALVFDGGAQPAGAVVSRSQLFQAILGLVEDLAGRSTTVLVLEDLHWADPSTRDLLTFIVSNLRSQRLVVAVTYRSDDLRRDHPLRPVLAELARHPQVERLVLPRFTTAQVGEQLEHLTGRRPSRETLDRVVARTQGNAYFVEELVAAGLEGRDLPASLRELVLVRADVVSPPARRLLRIASLAEDDMDDALLAEVSGMSLTDVRAHLHEAVDAQLVVTTRRGLRFRHALLRESLQADLLPGERIEYHATYARALRTRLVVGRDGGAAVLAELAFHLQEAGDVNQAMGAWVEAAAAAEAVFAFAEAHEHLTRALEAWDTADDTARHAGAGRAELLARAAEDAFSGGAAVRACTLVREAIDLVDETVDPRLAGMLHERLSRYLRDTPASDQVYETIERALRLVPAAPPSPERARVLAGWAGRLSTLGRLREARDAGAEAVAMAVDLGEAAIECDALNTLGAVNCYLDDEVVGLAQIDAALALAKGCGDSHQQMRAHWNAAVCRSENGRWDEASERYRTAIEELPRLGLAHLLPELYMYLAQDLIWLGRWDEARAAVDEAVRRFPSRADEAVSIDLLIGTGRFDEARRLVSAVSSRNVFTDEEGHATVMANLAALETWEGSLDAARDAVDAVLRLVVDSDRPIAAANALCAGMRCEADAAERARARRRPDELERARSRAAALDDHVRDLLARPGPEQGWKREVRALAAICAGERCRLEASPDPSAWEAAVQATQAMSMGYLLAYARFRHGEAIVGATGDRDEAAVLIREAHRAACTMGATPLRQLVERFARRARIEIDGTDAADVTLGLTPRERQVIDLLVQGATNRQIARQLFITEKTASVHVSNIIRKLGVGNRGEAAAVAHRAGLVT